MDGNELPSLINSDAVKKYYPWVTLVMKKEKKEKNRKKNEKEKEKGGIKVENP